jgi:hypothetical protein
MTVLKRARSSVLAVSISALSALSAVLGGCTTESAGTKPPKPAVVLTPLNQTKLSRWLSDPAAVGKLVAAKGAAVPGSRFSQLTAAPGTPFELMRATISDIDPREVRLAGVKTAELIYASLTEEQLKAFSKACFSESAELADRSAFGCPDLYLEYNKAAVKAFNAAGTFLEGLAKGNYRESVSYAFRGLQTGRLESLIPADDPLAKSSTSFAVAGVFPNLRHDAPIVRGSLTGDGSRLTTTWLSRGPIEVRTLATGEVATFGDDDIDGRTSFTAGAVSPDGSVLVGVNDGAVIVWDTATKKVLFRQSFGFRTNVTSRIGPANLPVLWSPNGKYVITEAGLDTFVWDAATWKPLRKHQAAVGAAWSPDSQRYVLVGMDDRPINEEIYEAELNSSEPKPEETFRTAIFSVADAKVEHEIIGVHSFATFTSNGKDVVLQSNDQRNAPVLWNLVSGQLEKLPTTTDLRTESGDLLGYRFENPRGSGSTIVSVIGSGWSPDGHRVADVGNSGVTLYSDVVAPRSP